MSGERDPLASIDAAVEALKNDDALGVFLVGDENIIAKHFPNDLMHGLKLFIQIKLYQWMNLLLMH